MFRPAAALLVTLLALLALAPLRTACAAEMHLEPADTTVTIGDAFTLRVVCDAVADLKGFQTAWTFPAARLQFTGQSAGNVLTDGPGDWVAFLLPDVTAPVDSAWVDAAKLDGSTAGPGVLAYLHFKASTIGTAALTCAWAEMRDSQNTSLAPGCAGGVVHVVGAVPARRPTWGELKRGYR